MCSTQSRIVHDNATIWGADHDEISNRQQSMVQETLCDMYVVQRQHGYQNATQLRYVKRWTEYAACASALSHLCTFVTITPSHQTSLSGTRNTRSIVLTDELRPPAGSTHRQQQ